MKNNYFIDFAIAPAAMLTLIFFVHHGLFMGHSFFTDVDEDTLTFLKNHLDSIGSNGWRPELGLGMSGFWGDPGAAHIWGIFRWWQELFDNPVTAYNASIILLLWGLCISQYVFLRKVIPNFGRTLSLLLAPTIILGSLRDEYLFTRWMVPLAIFTGPISLVLHEFFQRPLVKHYFLYTLILFFTCALGNSLALALIIFFSILILIAYVIYNNPQWNFNQTLKLIRGFFVLNLFSGISLVFLFAWIAYSLFIESQIVGYVRDPYYTSGSFFETSWLWHVTTRVLHAGLFSDWMLPLGLQLIYPNSLGIDIVSPIFPVVLLIFLFHKSRHFWEFAAKFIVLTLMVWRLLNDYVPGLTEWMYYPKIDFAPVFQVYQVVIIGIIIQKFREENLSAIFPRWITFKALNIVLILLYAGLFLLAFMVLNFPNLLLNGLQGAWDWITLNYLQTTAGIIPSIRSEMMLELMPLVIKGNVDLLNEVMGLSAVFFYGSTFLFLLLFFLEKWRPFLKIKGGKLFSLALLINSIFLSWAIYPLNKEPLIWDRQNFTQASPPIIIRDFDRIAWVGSESCYTIKDVVECIKSKYFGKFGPKRHVVGYRLNLGMDFSRLKSFTPKEIASLITAFLKIDNLNSPGALRKISMRPAKFSIRLYSFSGVRYILSRSPLPPSKNLRLIHSSFQFYMYQNLDAWPYYYLADRIDTIHEMKELYHSEKKVAYLWAKDSKPYALNKSLERKNSIELKYFKPGEIVFKTSSNAEEFLVVTDAWHPYWRAQIDGKETKVIKTNGAFKGIFLPTGDHKIRLFFDNKPYHPGIWISVIAWVIFAFAWAWLTRVERQKKTI